MWDLSATPAAALGMLARLLHPRNALRRASRSDPRVGLAPGEDPAKGILLDCFLPYDLPTGADLGMLNIGQPETLKFGPTLPIRHVSSRVEYHELDRRPRASA